MTTFHTINGFIALVSGLAVVLMSKGNGIHRILGYVYVASMYVLCFVSFAIQDTTPFFRGLGMFHVMALASIGTVTAGLIPALYRKPFSNWYEWHYSFMLWSYVGLVMALNSHFFREVFLFFGNQVGFGKVIGLILSIVVLWGLPPTIGRILIKRRIPIYRQRFGTDVIETSD
jgi:uncharacterized membrane protein